MATNIQNAISDLLQEKLNEAYQGLTGDTLNLFKCSTFVDFNFDGYTQFDENNRVVLNEYKLVERFIPVFVENVVGDREPLPNAYMAEVTIPISMIVQFDNVNLVIQTIQQFSNNTIGQVYSLEVGDENYSITFVPSLPDLSDFRIVQGEENKECSFELTAVISGNLNYGNQIEYELSMDNGATYEQLIKIEPSSTRSYDIHQDQIIGKGYTQGSIKTSTWSKSFTLYCFKNSNIANTLVFLTDFSVDELIENGVITTAPNWKLKIKYKDLLDSDLRYNQVYTFNNTPNITENVNVNQLNFKSNNENFIGLVISKTNNMITYVASDSTNNVVAFNNGVWDSDYKDITFINGLTTNNKAVLKPLIKNTKDITLYKNILISDISYTEDIGRFLGVTITMGDKL